MLLKVFGQCAKDAGLRLGQIVNDLLERGFKFTVRFRWTGYFMTPKYKHFSDEESVGLNPELMTMLDTARGKAGVPFTITSGARTADANLEASGVSNSSHLKGLAVDLRCNNSMDRFVMTKALLDVGFKRIGVYDFHLHCDLDFSLPQEVMWTGVSH